jgi:hypothetical protein
MYKMRKFDKDSVIVKESDLACDLQFPVVCGDQAQIGAFMEQLGVAGLEPQFLSLVAL